MIWFVDPGLDHLVRFFLLKIFLPAVCTVAYIKHTLSIAIDNYQKLAISLKRTVN